MKKFINTIRITCVLGVLVLFVSCQDQMEEISLEEKPIITSPANGNDHGDPPGGGD